MPGRSLDGSQRKLAYANLSDVGSGQEGDGRDVDNRDAGTLASRAGVGEWGASHAIGAGATAASGLGGCGS